MFFSTSSKLGIKFTLNEIYLVPEFEAVMKTPQLGEKAFRFIVSCYSYLSPYRHIPEETRIQRCLAEIYASPPEAITGEIMQAAIHKFNDLQFDSDFEEFYASEEKCTEIAQMLRSIPAEPVNMEILQQAARALAEMNKLKRELKEILFSKIESPEEKVQAMGNKKTSFADRQFKINAHVKPFAARVSSASGTEKEEVGENSGEEEEEEEV